MENTAIIRGADRTARPHARCGRSKTQRAKKRTRRTDGDGFLSHRFRPVCLFEGNISVMEREYLHSLSNLCRYYDLPIPDCESAGFPVNIYQSWQAVSEALQAKDAALTCLIIKDKGKQSVLATVKPFGLGIDLFYIPVRTYWRWATCAQQQAISELVLVIFAYLYQIVKIPFYQEHDSFMHNNYDTIYQWLMDAEEDDDDESKAYREHQEDTLYELQQAGAHILRLLENPYWLTQMGPIISNYYPKDNAEQEWADLANDYLNLFRDYPKASIFDNTRPDLLYPDEEQRISPEQYTGFYWSSKDCFADQLDDMINCDFQEIPVMDEPVAVQLFDTFPENNNHDFDFETRLFALMERLRDLLNNYDHEEYNGEF